MNAKKVKALRRMLRSFGLNERDRAYEHTNVRTKVEAVPTIDSNGRLPFAKVEYKTSTVRLTDSPRLFYKMAKAGAR